MFFEDLDFDIEVKPAATVPGKPVEFSIGYGKGTALATDLVNTSSIPLHNEIKIEIGGDWISTGYFSNSALETYTRCGKLYEYKYVLKERGRMMFKPKMYGGVGVHDVNDQLIKSMLDGKPMTRDAYLTGIVSNLKEAVSKYEEKYAEAKKAGEEPQELDFGSRISRVEQFYNLYKSVGEVFFDTVLPTLDPVSTEEMFIYHFDVKSGGSIPIVGFIDLVENYQGKPMITDHKVGAERSVDEVRTSQQLTLYSMAKKVPDVSINNFVLGTTGGKSERAPKPGQFLKLTGVKTMRDYERTHAEINATLAGIKAGVFPRSGVHNPIVCAKTQCPYYDKCMG